MTRMSFRVQATCMVVLLLAGCEEKVVHSGWERYGAATPGATGQRPTEARRERSAAAPSSSADASWAISLATFDGPDHAQQAERRRLELAAASGLKSIWVLDQGWRSHLYYGRYKSPGDRQAERDLAIWRELRSRGVVAVGPPVLVPTVMPGSNPRHNLLYVGPQFVYTLQIGHYDERFGKNFRAAAEQAAAALRDEGLEAYYYHGPDRSSVTIGAYPASAVRGVTSPGGRVENRIADSHILELQERFATYFVNGLEQRVRGPGGGGSTPVPTSLAEIPR